MYLHVGIHRGILDQVRLIRLYVTYFVISTAFATFILGDGFLRQCSAAVLTTFDMS